MAGAWPYQQAQRLRAGTKVRANRQGIAGDALFGGDVRRVAKHDPGVDQPEGGLCVRDREVDEAIGALTGRIRAHRVDDARNLPVAANEVGGELVLALRESAQLVVREGRQRRVRVTGGDPVQRGGERPQWRGQASGHDERDTHAEQRRDDERG